MNASVEYNRLLKDLPEAVQQVFEVVCAAVIVEDLPSPLFCFGDQGIGQRLVLVPGVCKSLADGSPRTEKLPQGDIMTEALLVGIEPLHGLPNHPPTVLAFALGESADIDRIAWLVHALSVEVTNELILLEKSPFLSAALAEVECGVTIADPNLEDTPLIYANDAFTRMTGYTRAETLGRNCRFLQGELRDQPGLKKIRNAMARSEKCTVQLTNMRRNGERFTNRFKLQPIYNAEGTVFYWIGIQLDVTKEQSALESLDLQRRRYKSLIEAGENHIWHFNAAGELQSVDPSWLIIAGVRRASDEQTPDLARIRDALTPQAAARFRHCWFEALQSIQPFEVVYQLPAESATPRWFQDRVAPILDDEGRLLEWFGVSREITKLKQAEQNLNNIIQAAPTGMLVVDREGTITLANHQASLLFGYSAQALVGMAVEALLPASSRKKHQQLRSAFCAAPSMRQMGIAREVKGIRQDGTEFVAEIGLSSFGEDHELRVVAAINDVTELNKAREAAERAAYEDRLTGLRWRNGFNRQLESWIDQHGWPSWGVVLLVNILGQRDINDMHGYEAGDQILVEFARRLADQAGEPGLAGRLGGDEFVLFLLLEPAEPLTTRLGQLRESLSTPFDLNGIAVDITFTLGYTLLGEHQRSVEELLREAERALSQHRKALSLPWVAYSYRLQKVAQQRIELTADLRKALQESQLELHFQPKVDLASGTLVACEALLRWHHPKRGLISPGVFIPIAEQSQLIVPIGDWVLRRACQHLRDWRDAGLKPVRVAVNVSVIQFQTGDFASRVRTVLDQTGIAAEELALEVTESVFQWESEVLLNQMRALRDMGVWLSLDDFGTGYSSLLYLQRYPFDEIKIDQGFVCRLLDDPFSHNIVETVMKLAKVLEAEIIAEGIESAEVRDALLAMGCHFGQGFFFSMPLEAEDFRWLLEQRSKLPLNTSVMR